MYKPGSSRLVFKTAASSSQPPKLTWVATSNQNHLRRAGLLLDDASQAMKDAIASLNTDPCGDCTKASSTTGKLFSGLNALRRQAEGDNMFEATKFVTIRHTLATAEYPTIHCHSNAHQVGLQADIAVRLSVQLSLLCVEKALSPHAYEPPNPTVAMHYLILVNRIIMLMPLLLRLLNCHVRSGIEALALYVCLSYYVTTPTVAV